MMNTYIHNEIRYMLWGNSIAPSWHVSLCHLNDNIEKGVLLYSLDSNLKQAAYLFDCTWICWGENNLKKKLYKRLRCILGKEQLVF